jgi:hypothetical protein
MIRRSDMTTNSIRPRAALVSALCALALAGCGGLGDDASIGGTLSGLGTGLNVILALNGAGNLTLTSDGAFTFATRVAAGATYSVTVVTQPLGQTCTVANASGTVSASTTTTTSVANITNVSVTCVASASITGTVTGLPAGTAVTLSNGTTTLPIAANGPFAFPGHGHGAAGGAHLHADQRQRGHSCDRRGFGDGDLRLTALPKIARYFRFRSSPPM